MTTRVLGGKFVPVTDTRVPIGREAGTQIAARACDDTVVVWNAATGERIRTYTGHQDEVLSVA